MGELPMSTGLLPMTMIVPTRNRATAFRRTLESLAAQSPQPAELIIVDATDLAGNRRSVLLQLNEPLLTSTACAEQ